MRRRFSTEVSLPDDESENISGTAIVDDPRSAQHHQAAADVSPVVGRLYKNKKPQHGSLCEGAFAEAQCGSIRLNATNAMSHVAIVRADEIIKDGAAALQPLTRC